MQNPYGAVPEALKDTRVSLRDIMADMLMNKKMEGDLSLAKSKAETETAMVNAGIARDQLTNQKDMAHLNIAGRTADTQAKIGESTVNLHNLQTKIMQKEQNRLNKPMTSEQYAASKGMPGIHTAFGFKGNEVQTLGDWEKSTGEPITRLMNQYPGLQLDINAHMMKNNLDDMVTKYHTPGLDQPTKDKLEKNINSAYDSLKLINDIKTNVKSKPEEIAKIASKNWMEDFTIQEKYKGDQQKYISDFADSVKQISDKYSTDLLAAKFHMKYGINPQDATNQIGAFKQAISQSGDPQAPAIILGIDNGLNKRKDLAGTYKYAKEWNDEINRRKGTAAAVTRPTLAAAAAATTPGTTPTPAAEEIPSGGAQRLSDAANALKTGAGAAWNATGGKLSQMMKTRADEQTAAYTAEITALKTAGKLTPQTREAAQRKYPYAQIQ